MDVHSRFDRIRQTLADAARHIETFDATGFSDELSQSDVVRRQAPSSLSMREARDTNRRRRAEEQPIGVAFAPQPRIGAALATRAGLRQAILMQEILAPPKALRAREWPD